jgi:imidazolonepropionase-like amidohydrolase
MRRKTYAAVALALAAAPLAAQERPVAFRGATILPIVGAPIQDGVLVVQGGKIVAVGGADTPVPQGAEVVDAAGRTIMPGLVDTHSHIGGGDGGDRSAPLHPAVRVLDAIDARDDGIQKAQAGGVTTVNVMPGSGLLMSGQTVYLKLRDGRTLDDLLVICRDPVREVCGGMKMANGTNPRGEPPMPATRGRSAALVRERFVRAQEYRKKIRDAGGAEKVSPRDLELEALAEVLDGRRMVHFHTHRADDILTALRLRDEFGFRMVLHHVSEAWKVAPEIARARVPASIIVVDAPGGKLETVDVSMTNGAALERAGAQVAFHTDDGITDSRFFFRQAALGVRAGMSRQRALEALTIEGARMLELERRVGSLERGKDADFIVLSGDPLSVYTQVLQTWVEGRKVFDRADPAQRGYAVGGFGVFRDGAAHAHEGEEGHR